MSEQSGLDIEGVLAEHMIDHNRRIYPSYSCTCGEWDGTAGGGAEDNAGAARAHVAAVLREQIATWLDGEEALGAVWKTSGLGMARAEQITTALAALAAEIGPLMRCPVADPRGTPCRLHASHGGQHVDGLGTVWDEPRVPGEET